MIENANKNSGKGFVTQEIKKLREEAKAKYQDRMTKKRRPPKKVTSKFLDDIIKRANRASHGHIEHNAHKFDRVDSSNSLSED